MTWDIVYENGAYVKQYRYIIIVFIEAGKFRGTVEDIEGKLWRKEAYKSICLDILERPAHRVHLYKHLWAINPGEVSHYVGDSREWE